MSQLAKSQRNKTASFLRSKLPRAYSKQTKRPESSQCEHGLLLDFRSQPAAFNKVNITETLAFLWYLCKSTCPYEGSPSNKLRIRICRQSFMLTILQLLLLVKNQCQILSSCTCPSPEILMGFSEESCLFTSGC